MIVMSEEDKIKDIIKYLNKGNSNIIDKIGARDVLLFMGGLTLGYGIKAFLNSDKFKNFSNNTKIVMRNYLDNSIEYVKPSDEDADIYVMNNE